MDTVLINKIFDRVLTDAKKFNGKLPPSTTDNNGRFFLSNGGGWTDSFFVGMLYLGFAYTGNKKFIEMADKYQPFYEHRAENDPDWCEKNNVLPLDHDTGFIFSLSQVRRFRLLDDKNARRLALDAAKILAGRFNEKGRFIRAWDTWKWDDDPKFIEEKKGKMIIDSMMNISLLFWAGKETGDSGFTDIALAHADTIMKYIVRKDFSTFHQFNFDPMTGTPINGCTGQGYSDDSCWSRGQSWAIYGFSQTYLNTGNVKYLETAKNCAYYFIDHLSPCGLPLWDFSCTDKPFRPYDASAASVALSGLLNIDYCINDEKIKHGIEFIYNGLIKHCSAMDIEDWESLLLHACVGPAYHAENDNLLINPNVDCPIIYADYYFAEAVLKMYDREKFIELLK